MPPMTIRAGETMFSRVAVSTSEPSAAMTVRFNHTAVRAGIEKCPSNWSTALNAAANERADMSATNASIANLRGNSRTQESQLKINIDRNKAGALGVDLRLVEPAEPHRAGEVTDGREAQLRGADQPLQVGAR